MRSLGDTEHYAICVPGEMTGCEMASKIEYRHFLMKSPASRAGSNPSLPYCCLITVGCFFIKVASRSETRGGEMMGARGLEEDTEVFKISITRRNGYS